MATAEKMMSALQSAQSVGQLFQQRAAADAKATAARYKVAGTWHDISWSDLAGQAEEVAWGLIALGVKKGDMVSILGSTRLEWTVCDMGIAYVSGVAVPIYQSNTPEECQFILENSGAVLCFVEDKKQLAKLTAERMKLPKVRHVILMDGEGDGQWSFSLSQLKDKGKEQKARVPGELTQRLQSGQRDELACVLYTSGTTGVPKGVMLTHDNMVFACQCIAQDAVLTPSDTHLLFLPFAHSFAQVIKCAWIGIGFTQIYAESVDKLVDNAGETHPTIMSGVPRIFEKAFNSVIAGGMAGKGLQGALFRMSMREFELYAKARAEGKEYSSLQFSLAKKLVFPKIAARLSGRFGGRIDRFVSGGAPLARKIALFFEVLGFQVLEGYGLTETMAMTTINPPGKVRVGTVGPPFGGIEVKIADDGEILERGRNVMRGYLGLPEATAEVIDKEGWFHTGDIGELDSAGYLKITDRKKDLIKTSGGKYIAPQALEGALKTGSELISQVVVIGDKRKYVSVLLTVVEAEAKKVAGSTDYAASTKSPAVKQKVQETIDKLNTTLPSYETIKRFHVLDRDFTQETGELTPTMKVKRKACTVKFAREIDAMYDGEAAD
ncbi:MAG TPA: AMP-binding protein [Myxococcales bacterium]|nr:AMP-binding protein [Myxococcales bacterium]